MSMQESGSDPNQPHADSPGGTAGGSESGRDESAATRFRQSVASKNANLDDFDHEEQLWVGGYSGRAMVGTWVLLAVITVLVVVAAVMLEPLTWLIALAVIVVMWAIAAAVYLWRRLGVEYELTTQRFIHKTGILTRRADRIEVIDIDDVSYSQGPVQRAFGVGKIVIISSDRSHPELTMVGIDKVADVAGLVDDIRRKERRRRSLHIEQI